MNPEQPPKKASHKKLGLVLVIAPSVLFIIALIVAVILNFTSGDIQSADSNNLFRLIAEVFVIIASLVSLLTWLPGMIAGIILLNKKN